MFEDPLIQAMEQRKPFAIYNASIFMYQYKNYFVDRTNL